MRILFTGASSFTGYWFVRELVAAGHQVVAACRGDGRYEGLRAERVRMVRELCETRYDFAFGNDNFLALAKTPFDVLCHHGAEVGDYRSPDFDPYRAAAANLHRLPEVLRALKDRGCGRLVLTGSVFEANEGAGSAPLRAFSPYGLSKTLTASAAAFYAEREGFTFEKVRDPEPVRPLRGTAFHRLPDENVACGRDRPRADAALCPRQYPCQPARQGLCRFCRRRPAARYGAPAQPERLCGEPGCLRSSACAARRRAASAGHAASSSALRLEFPEPPVRINIDLIDVGALEWDEVRAWDEFERYYARAASG